MLCTRSAMILACLAASCVRAQDMVAVSWYGDIYAVESSTGASWHIGYGLPGQNALANTGTELWSAVHVYTSPRSLMLRIDPAARTATPMFAAGDIRALAALDGHTLFALEYGASSGQLVRFDTSTGARTVVGPTNTGAIQGMTMRQGVLYAWDLNRGLGTLDQNTGLYTDINPSVNFGNVQWMTVRSDGALVGGNTRLGTIDVTTGVLTPYGQVLPGDLRGLDSSAVAFPYGAGCQGGSGQVVLSVQGTLRPGSLLSTVSTGHTIENIVFHGVGILIVGGSNTVYGGVALPLDLGPLLGTSGCSLLASADLTVTGGIVAISGALPITVLVPISAANRTFYLQHAAIEPNVPGLTSWSNGVVVHIGS